MRLGIVGSITAATDNSILITSDSTRIKYDVPKDEGEGFNGSDFIFKATFNRFEQFKVKVPLYRN